MILKFGDAELEGPFKHLEELEDKPGVVALLCMKDEKFKLLQVRTTTLVQKEVAQSVAEPGWSEVCSGKLRIAVYYSADEEQMEKVRKEVLWTDEPTIIYEL